VEVPKFLLLYFIQVIRSKLAEVGLEKPRQVLVACMGPFCIGLCLIGLAYSIAILVFCCLCWAGCGRLDWYEQWQSQLGFGYA
jgi:hypothetical protein